MFVCVLKDLESPDAKNVVVEEVKEVEASVVFFQKAKRLTKKVVSSDTGKFAVSQGLAYAPKLLDLSASKIKNKKVQQLLQSEMTKKLLKKGTDSIYSKL